MLEERFGLLENPGVAYGGAANEDAVDAVTIAGFKGLLWGGDVAIAENGDMESWVGLGLANKGPVGLAAIHLGLGAAMDADGGNTYVLELLGKGDDGFVAIIITEAGFDSNWEWGTTDYGSGDFKQLGDIFEHAGTATTTCNLADRTAPVDVDEIGFRVSDNINAGEHGVFVVAKNLDADGAFHFLEEHLTAAFLGVAYEGFASNELGDEDVGAMLLANLTEGHVGDVVHGGENEGEVGEIHRTENGKRKTENGKRRTENGKLKNIIWI